MEYFRTLLFGLCIFILDGCNYSNQYKQVDAGNDFSVLLPSWMSKQNDLKEGAAIQYANRYRNFYMIATTEDAPSQTLAQVMATNIAVVKKSLKEPIVSDSSLVTIGGLPGVRVEVFGKMNDENIYFSEVLLQGVKTYYHLSVWTRGEDRKLLYKGDINKILNSFKLQ